MGRKDQIQAAVSAWQPGACVSQISELQGGMSAELWLVDGVVGQGTAFRLVARFPGEGLASLVEDAVDYEFRTLEAVREAGIAAPRPVGRGSTADGSFLLLEYLQGKATAQTEDAGGYVAEFARALAGIHDVDLSSGRLGFLLTTRRQFTPRREVLNVELGEPEIVEALVKAGLQEAGVDVLRHGDFWPGNILWLGDRISGIIDWENALRGPAIADLAISRLDIFWILGRAAMEEFTARYLALRPLDVENLAYWDLRAALRPMPNLAEWAGPYESLGRPDVTPEHLRTVLVEFIEQGLANLR